MHWTHLHPIKSITVPAGAVGRVKNNTRKGGQRVKLPLPVIIESVMLITWSNCCLVAYFRICFSAPSLSKWSLEELSIQKMWALKSCIPSVCHRAFTHCAHVTIEFHSPTYSFQSSVMTPYDALLTNYLCVRLWYMRKRMQCRFPFSKSNRRVFS